MKFTKMQGAGNDFIVVDNRDGAIPQEDYSAIAADLCRRRMSVGADGFMVVENASEGGDFRMRFFNEDGSVGEMCGNGARCIAKYGYEKGIAGAKMVIETTAGKVGAERLSAEEYRVRLNDVTVLKPEFPLTALGKTWNCAYVELGNPGLPHLVVPYAGLRKTSPEELKALGAALRGHSLLPKGANVNFYDLTEDGLFIRTFERGVEDFTYACGTGTGSVVCVLTAAGLVTGEHTRADMMGGTLYVDASRNGEEITDLYLSGPAVIVAEGETAE